MRRLELVTASAIMIFAAASSRSKAQTIPKAPHKLSVRNASIIRNPTTQQPEINISFRDILDAPTLQKLQSGLPTVIVLTAGLFHVERPTTPLPSAGFWQSCRITFDVWNEVYRIRISRPDTDKQAVALNIEGVMRRCMEVRHMPLQGVEANQQRYFVAATVEVNPVSPHRLKQIRGWISNPPGLHATTPGKSLFSSFVGLFVARIGQADRTLSFRSQPFVVPP